MNLSELQAELRHFAAERDWQPFHTPKNLSTALLVEAAELAEIGSRHLLMIDGAGHNDWPDRVDAAWWRRVTDLAAAEAD